MHLFGDHHHDSIKVNQLSSVCVATAALSILFGVWMKGLPTTNHDFCPILALRFFMKDQHYGAVLEIQHTSLMVFFRIEKQDLSSMWTTYLPVPMKWVLRTPKRYLFYQGDSGAGCGALPG